MIATTKKSPRPRTGTQDDDRVKELVVLIKKDQQQEIKSRADLTLSREAIGAKLIELKELVEHGAWLDHLSMFGFEGRTAERLMALSRSPLGSKIRTAGTSFTASLPTDLQALATLSRLPAKLLARAVKRNQEESMTRAQINHMVRELLGVPQKVESANASLPRISPADDTHEEIGNAGDEDVDDDENEDEDDDEDQDLNEGGNTQVDEDGNSCCSDFLELCAMLDQLIDETKSGLKSEDGESSERERIMATATRLIRRLRRMLADLDPNEDG